MADRKERRLEAEFGDKEVDEKPTDLERNDAPSTATLTTKTINGNQSTFDQLISD